MNKKGQSEGMGLGTILAIIVGGAALVLIILGFSIGWGNILNIFSYAPDDLSKAAGFCKTYTEQDLLALDYCKYRELNIDDQKQWVNCDYIYDRADTILTGGAGFDGIPDLGVFE